MSNIRYDDPLKIKNVQKPLIKIVFVYEILIIIYKLKR